jgi:hypothetical protein
MSSSPSSAIAWPEVPTYTAPAAAKSPPAAPKAPGGPTSIELTKKINLQDKLAQEKLAQAVASDRGGDRKAAYGKYMVAADCFMDLVKLRVSANEDAATVKKQVSDILDRAKWLKDNANPGGSGGGHLSKGEIDVLMRSSVINQRLFQPFMEGEENAEQFFFDGGKVFADPQGKLALSPKQVTIHSIHSIHHTHHTLQ